MGQQRAVDCELCESAGGRVLWQDHLCRVVGVDDADYPGFCRVIATRHVREMTTSPPRSAERSRGGPRRRGGGARGDAADKMNVASLGNVTPHVHWHVIPRFAGDRHFPGPVWAEPRRQAVVPSAGAAGRGSRRGDRRAARGRALAGEPDIAATQSGLPLRPVYTAADVADLDELRDLGLPGQYPFTRGTQATGYRTKEWTRRQVIGLGTPRRPTSASAT